MAHALETWPPFWVLEQVELVLIRASGVCKPKVQLSAQICATLAGSNLYSKVWVTPRSLLPRRALNAGSIKGLKHLHVCLQAMLSL